VKTEMRTEFLRKNLLDPSLEYEEGKVGVAFGWNLRKEDIGIEDDLRWLKIISICRLR
jgi:hypothetical protein